jgi:hypothetical protein
MEISGFDPKFTICKIVVLPIKLYPLLYKIIYYLLSEERLERSRYYPQCLKLLCLPIPAFGLYKI